ncbi:hypothetical protein E4656_05275 [Natronospirillum operosum]|uniref:Uncharacterized protein n=1 Tax=Natronospirillum operosum TaxID=2759953 RepID=A0A4Z0WAZ0_9GAMM|nr:hypothetical protein [Natronospirillum operosum]TGG95819.1 hypothetical protein E4656_05275 [Natronospirillum operosum]
MPWKQVTIERPFEPESLLELLQEGARGSLSRYTHFDIVDWSRRYAEDLQQQAPLDEEGLLLWRIADDMALRWELHMASTYTIDDMKRFSQVDILLPKHYFLTWLAELDA